jgi:hypothetical protein
MHHGWQTGQSETLFCWGCDEMEAAMELLEDRGKEQLLPPHLPFGAKCDGAVIGRC